MAYLEYLRARRIFVWYAAFIVIVFLFMVGGAVLGNSVNFDMNDQTPSGSKAVHIHGLSSLGTIPVPLAALAGIAGVLAIAFGTALASSLNRDTQNAHFLFVRPLSRYKMAALTIGVDIASIVAAGLFAFAFALLTALGMLREHVHFLGADTLGVLVLGLGAAVMWYGILQALSAWTPRRGGVFVGIGTAVLAFAIPLSHATFLGPLMYLFKGILFIDPLAYFTSVTLTGAGDVSIGAQILASVAVRAALVWLLGAAALAIATYCWNRVEI